MIELIEEQAEAIQTPEEIPPRIIDPKTKETYVLLRAEEYTRMTTADYDDSPWTREELHALAWNAGKLAGWEEMDEYDDFEEKP